MGMQRRPTMKVQNMKCTQMTSNDIVIERNPIEVTLNKAVGMRDDVPSATVFWYKVGCVSVALGKSTLSTTWLFDAHCGAHDFTFSGALMQSVPTMRLGTMICVAIS